MDPTPKIDLESAMAELLEQAADVIRECAPGESILLKRIDGFLEERQMRAEEAWRERLSFALIQIFPGELAADVGNAIRLASPQAMQKIRDTLVRNP